MSALQMLMLHINMHYISLGKELGAPWAFGRVLACFPNSETGMGDCKRKNRIVNSNTANAQ